MTRRIGQNSQSRSGIASPSPIARSHTRSPCQQRTDRVIRQLDSAPATGSPRGTVGAGGRCPSRWPQRLNASARERRRTLPRAVGHGPLTQQHDPERVQRASAVRFRAVRAPLAPPPPRPVSAPVDPVGTQLRTSFPSRPNNSPLSTSRLSHHHRTGSDLARITSFEAF